METKTFEIVGKMVQGYNAQDIMYTADGCLAVIDYEGSVYMVHVTPVEPNKVIEVVPIRRRSEERMNIEPPEDEQISSELNTAINHLIYKNGVKHTTKFINEIIKNL